MNRRRFLGASAAGTATLLAGCLGSSNGGTSSRPVTKWLVPRSPGESNGDTDEILAAAPSRKLEIDDESPKDLEKLADEETAYVWGDVDPGAVDLDILAFSVDNGSYSITTGSFDASEARSALDERSGTGASSYEGFDVYPGITAESGPTTSEGAVAVGDGVVVEVWNYPGEPTDLLHRVVDAGEGTGRRLIDQHDGLATATSRLDNGFSTQLYGVGQIDRPAPYRGAFAGVTAYGTTHTFGGKSVRAHEAFVFGSADAAKSAALDSYVSAEKSRRPKASVSQEVDGNVIEVTASMPPSSYWG